MLKIQYGIAGFFAGIFAGLLLILAERALIGDNRATTVFFVGAATIIICAVAGMTKGIRMAKKKLR